MNLSTERLLVRDLDRTDLTAVHRLLDVDSGMDDRSEDERARWLTWMLLEYEQRARVHQPPYGEYAVVAAATGELVGLVGLVPSMMPFGLLGSPRRPSRHQSPVDSYNVPEVGLFWVTGTEHRGRGYATEAAQALIEFGFGSWKLRRMVATTEHGNGASIAVMRRLGMRIERNPEPAPFFLQMVGVLENPHPQPDWLDWADDPDRPVAAEIEGAAGV